MEFKQIKELMSTMGRTGMKKLSIKKEGFELELEREGSTLYKSPEEHVEYHEEIPFKTEPLRPTLPLYATEKEEPKANYVTSPMVGIFYTAPSPEDAPFVKVGDKIEADKVVGIIEAMKVMNEIKAGVAGTVLEVLVESGHPVEFGSKLFRIS
jgi:acetyl-CoA carboxylase biotin carboxyl carrier protein